MVLGLLHNGLLHWYALLLLHWYTLLVLQRYALLLLHWYTLLLLHLRMLLSTVEITLRMLHRRATLRRLLVSYVATALMLDERRWGSRRLVGVGVHGCWSGTGLHWRGGGLGLIDTVGPSGYCQLFVCSSRECA